MSFKRLQVTSSKLIRVLRPSGRENAYNPSNLLWNFEVKDKTVANYSFRTPYHLLANAPKTGDLNAILPDKDSILTESVQVVAIFHSSK